MVEVLVLVIVAVVFIAGVAYWGGFVATMFTVASDDQAGSSSQLWAWIVLAVLAVCFLLGLERGCTTQ